MKVIYRIPIKEGALISAPTERNNYKLDGVTIEWEVDREMNLKAIILVISGIPVTELKYDENKRILPRVSSLEGKIFRVISYIANRILIEKRRDVLDFDYLSIVPADIYPETSDETNFFPNGPIEALSPVLIKVNIFNKELKLPENFEKGFACLEVFANYADGLRVLSPFLMYEQFYKAVGHFFHGEGKAFDIEVSSYASNYDPQFDQGLIEKLRLLRNRIIHPNHKKGHLTSSDIASRHEVEAALPLLHSLVKILLQNPPGGNDEKT